MSRPASSYKRYREKLVRITFSDRRMGYDLAEFFRRTECSAELVGQHVLEVNPRLPLLQEAAKLEIEGLLRVWCKLHPDAEVTVSTLGRTDPASTSDVV